MRGFPAIAGALSFGQRTHLWPLRRAARYTIALLVPPRTTYKPKSPTGPDAPGRAAGAMANQAAGRGHCPDPTTPLGPASWPLTTPIDFAMLDSLPFGPPGTGRFPAPGNGCIRPRRSAEEE